MTDEAAKEADDDDDDDDDDEEFLSIDETFFGTRFAVSLIHILILVFVVFFSRLLLLLYF